ncbi:MAG: hypothetical protein AB7E51_11670 [Pseudodesulfovibrio sp.]|jgi:hypothetical protein|uniref:Uncharacterized protein n=1 Tax=Pseudodesulfovibrio indicus TaxID=1716143 RepID=A0A126QK41_9BACT|nr:hypothetical protein [Pseudodesulfovibrio indicus]AMK10402.1 hypothetical protein AWY79_04365 [Pseudodesulfovibrio indicus]TDT89207.1 hypothetical protein EDC59_104200 [Pseudodesulfovibrio indicus]
MKTLRTLTLFVALAFLAAPALASDYTQVPHPDGFRGLAWGTPLSEIKDLTPVQKAGFENTYFRRNEDLTFGKAELVSVAYYFRNDKLYRVGIAYAGRVNQFFIKDMLLQKYGEGHALGFRYGWMWPDFSIELNYDGDENTGSLYYTFEGPLK